MKTILVTGDLIFDHNYYQGTRRTADSSESPGFRFKRTPGGAWLLKDLITEVSASNPGWQTEFGLECRYSELPSEYHAFCLWQPVANSSKESSTGEKSLIWRSVEPPLGYGHPGLNPEDGSTAEKESCGPLGRIHQPKMGPEILVIDDAGLGFRREESRNHWPFTKKGKGTNDPRWIVLKLSGSVEGGELWGEIVSRSHDNLLLIVSADQLRRSNVRISRGMSWEATMEDLGSELEHNSALKPLLAARHLIVTFQSDSALWVNNDRRHGKSSLLVFDAENAEGEWRERQGHGSVFGFMSCFTAAIVHQLCRTEPDDNPDLESALIAGLGASRELLRLGHGRIRIKQRGTDGSEKEIENPHPGFPFDDIAKKILHPTDKFVSAPIPARLRDRGNWMMLDEWQVHARRGARQRPHFEAALAVAVLGPNALERFPVARFGGLQTIDRKEIESLRTIRQLISHYERVLSPKNPLNLGVFGPPGAGKSFGVKQIAKAVLNIEEKDILTFNLSQFGDPRDMNGAFHQVRDKVLSGRTPLVFWDEFDSQGYRWLQYLLAPMQDGAFQDGQISHPIGKCVFVFAGATSQTLETFGPCNPDQIAPVELRRLKPDQLRDLESKWLDFVLKKGPDFKSRLVGYLNVLGPNPRQICREKHGRRHWSDDPGDLCYPIRRAFFMRQQFKTKDDQRLNVDTDVLRAMLQISHYKAGARSLEFLCQHLQQNKMGTPGRSDLPGHQLFNMHLKAAAFWEICDRNLPFVPIATPLATALHEAYRLRIKGRVEKAHLDVPFAKLSADMQSANIAQALRIPGNLALMGLRLSPGPLVSLKDLPSARRRTEMPLRRLLAEKENLELLAEAEHNGWMVERMLNGWRYARTTTPEKKLHDSLIPYSQLPDHIKNYDRWTIVGTPPPKGKPHKEQFGYVDLVKTVGLRVAKQQR